MDSIIAIVKDCLPNDPRPGLDLYFPAGLAQVLGWRHEDEVSVVLPDGSAWLGTIGIKPPNLPYVHRTVRSGGSKRSMRDLLVEFGVDHGARVEFTLGEDRGLRWVRTLDAGAPHPARSGSRESGVPTDPRSARRAARSEPQALKTSGTAYKTFPFDDADSVRRLAETYWSLISAGDREEERAFELELPTVRSAGVVTKALFVRLARWKSKRKTPDYLSNTELAVETATRAALAESTDAGAITALTQLHGVALRTATALLHWLRPDEFPILDVRVVAALGEAAPSSWEDVGFYERIASQVREHAKRLDVSLRTMDRALWAWDKQRDSRA